MYQGLDVAIFGPLKTYFSEECATYEREQGLKVKKESFLQVYGRAHVRAFKPEVILSAFQKTGVHPFNPNAINPNQLAPSRHTSYATHMPLPQPTPIRAVSRLLRGLTIASTESSRAGSAESSVCPSPDSDAHDSEPVIDPQLLIEETLQTLRESSQKQLFTGETVRSGFQQPALPVRFNDQPTSIDPDLLNTAPHTAME